MHMTPYFLKVDYIFFFSVAQLPHADLGPLNFDVCMSHTIRHTNTPWRIPFNPLTPNDPYSGRTAPLTSKRCILYIYSTNTGTEYFKLSVFSSSKCSLFHNSNVFGSCLFTFYIQGVLEFKKNNSGAKRLTSGQPVAEAATNITNNTRGDTSMPSAGFEPTIPAIERPQTWALVRTANTHTAVDKLRLPDYLDVLSDYKDRI